MDLNVVETWTENILPSLLAEYPEENVFNADETGLFYHMMPNKTLHFRGERCTGGKQSKERISVLVGANMAGTEKLKLLVIGKAEKPRCFKNVKSLPVDYKNNRKAWMTSDIFVDWLKSLDKKFRVQNRHCLMIVDNCTSHPNPLPVKLTNLTINFLPKNTTSHTQPCDAGIIRDLKRKYRTRLIRKMLAQIDASPTSSNFKPNILDAIRMISAAWEEVKPETVKNCFRKAGWKKTDGTSIQTENVEDDEDTIPLSVLRERLRLPETMTFEDYVNVDNDVQAHEELTEEDILASLQSTEIPFDEEEEDEDDNDGSHFIENRVCAATDAKHYLTELRRFFEYRAITSDVEFSSIAKLESSLLKNVNNNQTSIQDYFQ